MDYKILTMLELLEQSHNQQIILASASPRRKEILDALGLKFKVETRPVKEVFPNHLEHHEISDFLAELKASAFDDLAPNNLVITGDTIVWHQNKALGKPRDYNDAFKMLTNLSGQTHEVISSISLKTSTQLKTVHEVTKVSFKALSEEEITHYINTYLPYDKAGAYGIQEWIGQIGISTIEGSFYNVMGLPCFALYQALKEVLNKK